MICIGDTRIGILVSILASQEAVLINKLSLPLTVSHEKRIRAAAEGTML